MKTLKEEEKVLLLDKGILTKYHEYMKTNKDSLLSKYMGVFTIKISHMADITCIIMDNLLGKDVASIERIYDLKGSTKGRIVPLKDSLPSGLKVLKDLNFVSLEERLKVTRKEKERLLRIIESDARFLSNNNLMDYSLLFIKAKRAAN